VPTAPARGARWGRGSRAPRGRGIPCDDRETRREGARSTHTRTSQDGIPLLDAADDRAPQVSANDAEQPGGTRPVPPAPRHTSAEVASRGACWRERDVGDRPPLSGRKARHAAVTQHAPERSSTDWPHEIDPRLPAERQGDLSLVGPFGLLLLATTSGHRRARFATYCPAGYPGVPQTPVVNHHQRPHQYSLACTRSAHEPAFWAGVGISAA